MTPRKSRFCGTMSLPSSLPYYPLPCICVHFFAIDRSSFTTLWHSSESNSFLTDALLLDSCVMNSDYDLPPCVASANTCLSQLRICSLFRQFTFAHPFSGHNGTKHHSRRVCRLVALEVHRLR
ncbi:hypothetical protein GW17_00043603 [Ensete ventricosum]|nr:hypothetical protein GW17_00043603 [Ensete ventricosum]